MNAKAVRLYLADADEIIDHIEKAADGYDGMADEGMSRAAFLSVLKGVIWKRYGKKTPRGAGAPGRKAVAASGLRVHDNTGDGGGQA